MNTEQNTLPLWKELNQKRTQGEWHYYSFSNFVTIEDESTNHLFTNDSNGNEKIKEQAKNNAQYTALAVNNFAQVCEALEEVEQVIKEREPNIEDDKEYLMETISTLRELAKQVLNNIK